MSASVASSATTYQDSPAPQTMQQNNHHRGHHRYGDNKSRDPLHHQPTPSVTPGQPHTSNNSTNDDDATTYSAENNHRSNGQSQTQSQTQAEEEEWLMACRCESGKTLVTLLSCLQHVASSPSDQGGSSGFGATQATSSRRRSQKQQNTIQPVTVFCMPSGFTFHVFGPAKQSEASMELQKSMFSHYQVLRSSKDDDEDDDDNTNNDSRSVGEFCVNLCSVLDALQLLGPLDHRISVGLSYNLQTEIFKVELLQDVVGGGGGILCTAAIPGLNSPADDAEGGDSLAHAFRSAPIAVRMMVRSAILKELLPEWSSVTGATSASVTVSQSRGLELVVEGHFGECWVQIPATGDHIVSPLEIDNPKKVVSRKYPLHSLLSSMKGLEISEETCISINGEGIMAIQHKTIDPTGQGCSNYVDFMMTCLEEDLDNDDESVTQVTASVAPASPSSSWRAWDNKSRNSQSQDGTTTTTRTRRNKRHKNRTTSPAQDDDGTATNTNNPGGSDCGGNDEDVEQGSSDTEGEAESPMERQQRQNLEKRQREALMYDDDDEDDDPTPISAIAPLFGSVVREAGDENKSETPRRRRRRQSKSSNEEKGQAATKRGKIRSKSRRGRGKDWEDDNGSEGSKNYLLAGSSEDEKSESDSSDDEPLDITNFPRSPKHRQRDGECSSPEIVYGER